MSLSARRSLAPGLQSSGSSGSGAQTKDHSILDLLDRSVCHGLLHLGLEIHAVLQEVGRDRSKTVSSRLEAPQA